MKGKIKALSQEQRDWLSRLVCDGETVEQIAAGVGKSHQYVSKVIERARKRLAMAGVPADRLAKPSRPKARAVCLSPEVMGRLVDKGGGVAGFVR